MVHPLHTSFLRSIMTTFNDKSSSRKTNRSCKARQPPTLDSCHLASRLHFPARFKIKVEVIDAHRLSKAPGQLITNPYVVLTLNGEPFARSTTARGTISPMWSSETFRVKLPASTDSWHLTAPDYFRDYRSVEPPPCCCLISMEPNLDCFLGV